MKTKFQMCLSAAAIVLAGVVGGCAMSENGSDEAAKKNGTCCAEGTSAAKSCCTEGASAGKTCCESEAKKTGATAK